MGDAREQQLQKELADCVLGASWWWCVAGVALAVPLGVRQKSYMPVVYMGVAGTLLDLMNGYDKCKVQRQALESYLRSKEAFGEQPTSLERNLGQRERDT